MSLRDFIKEKEVTKRSWIKEVIAKVNVQEFAQELSSIIEEKGAVALPAIERYLQDIAGKEKLRHLNPAERELVTSWLRALGFKIIGNFRKYITE